MKQRSSAPARVLAVVALIASFVVVIAIVAGSLGGEDDDGTRPGGNAAAGKAAKGGGGDEEPPKSYVVQNGDTLTSIASKTGVSVDRIEELNPGVDPQILVSGEKLKLR
jgi:LysM repeat protein